MDEDRSFLFLSIFNEHLSLAKPEVSAEYSKTLSSIGGFFDWHMSQAFYCDAEFPLSTLISGKARSSEKQKALSSKYKKNKKNKKHIKIIICFLVILFSPLAVILHLCPPT